MCNKTISINDLGPVDHLSIPLVPGVVVLRGKNGCGKTTVIEGVRKAIGGDGEGLSPRDEKRRGVIEVGDCKLTVSGKQTRRTGELVVSEIESRLELSSLVDPGIKDPERADAARIKALVALSGVSGDLKPYRELLENVPEGLQPEPSGDPLVTAGRVKRALEKAARMLENDAARLSGKIETLKSELADFPERAPKEESELRTRHDQLTEQLARLREQRDAHSASKQRICQAQTRLKEMPEIEDVADLETQQIHVEGRLAEAMKRIETLELELVDARHAAASAQREVEIATKSLATARHTAEIIDGLKNVISESVPPCPEQTEINKLEEQRADCVSEIANARKYAEQVKKKNELENETARMERLERYVHRFRRNAFCVELVLSAELTDERLRVVDGRLVCQTDRSDAELFCELSHGERYRIAIDIALEQLPEGGVLTIDQEGWEGLDPANQEIITRHAIKRGVCILTAEASDGPLSVVHQGADGDGKNTDDQTRVLDE